MKDKFEKYEKLVGEKLYDLDIDDFDYSMQNSSLAMAGLLEEKGIPLPESKETESYSGRYGMKDNMREIINEKNLFADFINYIDDIKNEIGATSHIFKGYTYSGSRKYVPATVENISKDMKQRGLTDGEGIHYGLGSFRAKVVPRLSNIKKISEAGDRIVDTAEFEKAKAEMETRYSDIIDDYYNILKDKPSNPFIARDEVSQGLSDYVTNKFPSFEDRFNAIPQSLREKTTKFVEDLKEMPTEYFESKFTRPVNLGEFSYAIIPDNSNADLVKNLKSQGLEIIEYIAGNEVDRLSKIKNLQELADSKDIFFKKKFGNTLAFQENETYYFTKTKDYLDDVKQRLQVDFDTYLFAEILYQNQSALGATVDNTILLASVDQMTKAHETMHLILGNANRMPIFKRAGLDKQIILEAQAKESGKVLTRENAGEIEEDLAYNFEKYLENKYKPKGIIARFFEILRTQFAKFKRAINLSEGNIVTDFYDILDEGVAKESEYMRLENKGLIKSFLEDSAISEDLPVLDLGGIAGVSVKSPMFKFEDAKLNRLNREVTEIDTEFSKLDSLLEKTRNSLYQELQSKLNQENVLTTFGEEVKNLSKYTYKKDTAKHKRGDLTKAGLEAVAQIEDANIQEKISNFVRVKIEVKDAKKRISSLRKEIQGLSKNKKLTSKAESSLKKQIRKRKVQVKLIKKGYDISAEKVVPKAIKQGTKYGKKAKTYEIQNRQKLVVEKLKKLPLSVRGRISLLVAVKNTTSEASFDRVMKKVDKITADYEKAKVLSKQLSSERSIIGFLKHLGDMDQYLVNDVKKQLGLEKPIREMNQEELKSVVAELKSRLKFKLSKGLNYQRDQLTEEEYNQHAIEEAKKGRMYRLKEEFKNFGFLGVVDKMIGASSTRLYAINPELSRKARDWYIGLQKQVTEDEVGVKDFLDGLEKLESSNKADFNILDLALKNRDIVTVNKLLSKHGLDMKQVNEVLKKIRERTLETNIDIGNLENYFPRQLKAGLEADMITLKQKKAEMQLGRELTLEERALIGNSVLMGFDAGKKLVLNKAGNVKERLVDIVDLDSKEMYENSIMALKSYIQNMNSSIEARKFFGKFAKNDSLETDYKDTIGAYVMDLATKGRIKPKEVLVVSDILKGLFARKQMDKLAESLTGISYVLTMGNLTSAITQLQDFSFSLAINGIWGTVSNIPNGIFRRGVSLEELYLDDSALNEVGKQSSLSNAVKYTFTLAGIRLTDSLALRTFVNARFDAYKKMARQKKLSNYFVREMQDALGSDYEKALADLKKGELSEEVKRLIIDDVLDIRPQGPTEKAEYYNTAENGKILYTLKQYTLKQLDVYRKQVVMKITRGIATKNNELIIEGMKNFTYLSVALVLMGAGADELKDYILGRTVSFRQNVINNILKLFAVNRYAIDIGLNEGLGSFVNNLISPIQVSVPFDLVSNFWKDMVALYEGELTVKDSKAIKYVPLVGNVLKNRIGSSAEYNEKDKQKQDKEKVIKDSISQGLDEDYYIEELQKTRTEELTPQAIGQLKREYRILQEYGKDDEYATKLEGAKDNNEKVEILTRIAEELDSDFEYWLDNAVDVGLVSDQLYDKFISED